jgi:hypothetical protein
MVEQDVEKVLADIRAQVIGATVADQPATPRATPARAAAPSQSEVQPAQNSYPSMTVLARAWDRLPPLVSNRTGASARFELWIKAKLKRALKWIVWEQVNFNAATRHTFEEIIGSLNAYEERLVQLQDRLDAEAETVREQLKLRQQNIDVHSEQLKQLVAEVRSRGQQLETLEKKLDRQQVELDGQRTDLSAQQAILNGQRVDLNERIVAIDLLIKELTAQVGESTGAQQAKFGAFGSEQQAQFGEFVTGLQANVDTKFAALLKEFRERDERLLDEQRVCFRQLSLELTESQVLQDRARRELEARIEKLEQ